MPAGFLLWKAGHEIHHTISLKDEHPEGSAHLQKSFFSVIAQIVILDIVFSIDSVITAIGLTGETWIIIAAVGISFIAILAFLSVGIHNSQHKSILIQICYIHSPQAINAAESLKTRKGQKDTLEPVKNATYFSEKPIACQAYPTLLKFNRKEVTVP